MIDGLIELICTVWKTDTHIRTSSLLGEPECSRRYRRIFGLTCIILIIGCLILDIYLES